MPAFVNAPIRAFVGLAFAFGLFAPPAAADTTADKPRLAVAIEGGNQSFLDALARALGKGHRFTLADGAQATRALRGVALGRRLTVRQAQQLLETTGAELVLQGSYSEVGGLHVTTRLYDLRTGDFSRELSLMAEGRDGGALAGQLANYVRQAVPIHCQVKDLREDQVVLDLGAMDGVTPNSLYRIYRNPANLKPLEIGSLRVTDVKDFAALGEVEDAVKGFKVAPGDALVEQTSGLLIEGK